MGGVKPDINEDDAKALMISMRSDVDRYRDRARSAATLLATVTGALAAGLIFSGEARPISASANLMGPITILLLTASVAFFLSGSLYHLKDSGKTKPKDAQTVTDIVETINEQANNAASEISKRIRVGGYLASIGVAVLMAMIFLNALLPEKQQHVSVKLLGAFPEGVPSCMTDDTHLDGYVSSAELASTSAFIPVRVKDSNCENADGLRVSVIYLDRSSVLISEIGE